MTIMLEFEILWMYSQRRRSKIAAQAALEFHVWGPAIGHPDYDQNCWPSTILPRDYYTSMSSIKQALLLQQNGEEVLRKDAWMPEEDKILVEYVRQFGARDWSSIRCKGLLPWTGKSCPLQWLNKLKPDLKKVLLLHLPLWPVTNSAEKGITGNNTQICNIQVLGAQHLKTSTERKP